MNNKWSNLILNRMIDKYERTTAYVNGEFRKIGLFLIFTVKISLIFQSMILRNII